MGQSREEAVMIEGEFETQYVIQNFGKLRNIILNTQDEIIEFMVIKYCQHHILQLYFQKMYSKMQGLQGFSVNNQIDSRGPLRTAGSDGVVRQDSGN
jgi:hypothetical protein